MNETVVKVAGVPIDVSRSGTGPPVLFVHGVYVNGRLWDAITAKVAQSYTCYVPTFPFGAHTIPVGADWRPTLEDLAGLVPGIIQELDLRDVTVVGNDTGGGLVLLALGSGHAAIGRIRRVVLTNCDNYDHFPPAAFKPLITIARKAPPLAKAVLRLMLATGFGRRRLLTVVSAGDPGQYVESLFNATLLDEAVRVTAALHSTPRQREMAWLTDLDIPVQLVWGDNDRFFPPSHAARLRSAIPHATVTVVPGAKTYVPLDAPEPVAAAITAG